MLKRFSHFALLFAVLLNASGTWSAAHLQQHHADDPGHAAPADTAPAEIPAHPERDAPDGDDCRVCHLLAASHAAALLNHQAHLPEPEPSDHLGLGAFQCRSVPSVYLNTDRGPPSLVG